MREIWRRTLLAWHVLRAAILHVPTAAFGTVLDRYLEHLSRTSDTHRERRIDRFLRMIQSKGG